MINIICVTIPTQPQLNSKAGCDMKMTLIHHHHHPPHKLNVSNISAAYWPDFDETLKVASWEDLEQILTRVWPHLATFGPIWTFMVIIGPPLSCIDLLGLLYQHQWSSMVSKKKTNNGKNMNVLNKTWICIILRTFAQILCLF